MIAEGFGPIKDVVHVHLLHFLLAALAKAAGVAVAALYELADGSPALAAIPLAASLPVRRLVAGHAIGGVLDTPPVLQAGKPSGAEHAWRVKLRMGMAVCAITQYVAKLALGMTRLSPHDLTAVWTYRIHLVLAQLCCYLGAEANGAAARAEVMLFRGAIRGQGFVSAARHSRRVAAAMAGKRDVAALVAPLPGPRIPYRFAAVGTGSH